MSGLLCSALLLIIAASAAPAFAAMLLERRKPRRAQRVEIIFARKDSGEKVTVSVPDGPLGPVEREVLCAVAATLGQPPPRSQVIAAAAEAHVSAVS